MENNIPDSISEIDPNKLTPLHEQLKEIIREKIDQGVYKQGDKIPSESEWQKRYKISRTPIRQAIAALVADECLVTKPGKGTFVSQGPIVQRLTTDLFGFHEDMKRKNIQISDQILGFEIVKPNNKVRIALGIASDIHIIRIERVFLIKNQPFSFQVSNIPYVTPITKIDFYGELERWRSITYVFEKIIGKKIMEAEQTIKACFADIRIAQILKIEPRSILMWHQRTVYDESQNPIEYGVAYFDAKKYEYHIKLKR
jgi:GntR family transcriptional regulator